MLAHVVATSHALVTPTNERIPALHALWDNSPLGDPEHELLPVEWALLCSIFEHTRLLDYVLHNGMDKYMSTLCGRLPQIPTIRVLDDTHGELRHLLAPRDYAQTWINFQALNDFCAQSARWIIVAGAGFVTRGSHSYQDRKLPNEVVLVCLDGLEDVDAVTVLNLLAYLVDEAVDESREDGLEDSGGEGLEDSGGEGLEDSGGEGSADYGDERSEDSEQFDGRFTVVNARAAAEPMWMGNTSYLEGWVMEYNGLDRWVEPGLVRVLDWEDWRDVVGEDECELVRRAGEDRERITASITHAE